MIKGHGPPIHITFERTLNRGRRLQPLADMPYVEITRNRLDKGRLEDFEYSEEECYQVPDVDQNRTLGGWERRRNLQNQKKFRDQVGTP